MSADPKSGRPDIIVGADDRPRCWWCEGDDLYRDYHDTEWGVPTHDDRQLFEKICLEGFQAGLSWLTILKKRKNFRKAFHNFDIDRVASMGPDDVERLLQDAGIIRHRRKIESTINNARRAQAIREEFGSLSVFLWRFAPTAAPERGPITRATIPAQTPASVALSKELKRRGFSFVGPTTLYAFMQSEGMVDDHCDGCWRKSGA